MSTSQNSSPNNNLYPVDFRTFIDRTLKNYMSTLNCSTIGTIKSFNSTNQTVTVAINYLRNIKGSKYVSTDVTIDQYVPYQLLINVPVISIQGGGAYLTMPISAGDQCIVLFSDREIDTWFAQGSANPQPPASDRTHDLNDGIALVGVRNSLNPIANYNTQIASLTDTTGERLAQAGMMSAYAGASAPSGWLLCQGQSVSRGTYAILFAVIGTTYGAGNGSTTFNLPDMRGQVAAGIGGTLGLTLGQEFGEVNHVLTINEMPSHTHQMNQLITSGSGGSNGVGQVGGGQNTSYTGGGLSHNNVQPSLGVNWIIKY